MMESDIERPAGSGLNNVKPVLRLDKHSSTASKYDDE